MSEPKVIYLGPACEAGQGDGRTWAEDNPWPDCECGHRPVQYVLGETFNRMKAERDALQLRLNTADQRIDELTQAQGEPVAWAANSDLAAIKHGALFSGTLWGVKNPPMLEGRKPLYASPGAPTLVASRDDSIYWLKRIDGIGQNRAELIYSMGFRRHTEPGEL